MVSTPSALIFQCMVPFLKAASAIAPSAGSVKRGTESVMRTSKTKSSKISKNFSHLMSSHEHWVGPIWLPLHRYVPIGAVDPDRISRNIPVDAIIPIHYRSSVINLSQRRTVDKAIFTNYTYSQWYRDPF